MKRAASWVFALVVAGACTSADGKPPPKLRPPAPDVDVTAQDYVMPTLPRARVTLTDAFGGAHVVDSEVAATNAARTRGLMWRTELADGKGMIFLFPAEQQLSFWMRNTLIPLDMVFITKDWKIAGIVDHAEPRTTSPRAVERPSMYVLEVPAGWCARVGLRPGGAVKAEGLASIPVSAD